MAKKNIEQVIQQPIEHQTDNIKYIGELKQIGIGKKCIIIGNGLSIASFDFSLLKEPFYIIGINDYKANIKPNMLFYFDKEMQEHYTQNEIDMSTILIGYQEGKINYLCPRCNYYYSHNDIVFADTGCHALQFADRLFNFPEIYLVGFDYDCELKTYHYKEDNSDREKLVRFLKHSIQSVQKYYKIKWQNKIYNCNNQSALKAFEYKLPY